jgi:hypothetical protein
VIYRTDRLAVIWIDGPLPGMNEMIAAAKGSRGKGLAYSRMKKEWTDRVWAISKSTGINKPAAFDRPVSLQFVWVERDKKRDPDNVTAARKFILDGLVNAGVLQGDGWRWINGWWDRWDVNPDRPGVGVNIIVPEPTVQMASSEPESSSLAKRAKRRGG